MFSGLPSAAPGNVLVVDREGQPVRVLAAPGDRLTAGEARWGQIRTLYAVDITDHHLEFSETLPCKDDVGGFRASIKLSCKVTDPADVVHRGIHDVARVLIPPVTETLRRVCGEADVAGPVTAACQGLPARYRHNHGVGVMDYAGLDHRLRPGGLDRLRQPSTGSIASVRWRRSPAGSPCKASLPGWR
jgi:hypothetical protein